MTPLEIAGRRFANARIAAGLTQGHVAARVSLARSSIANFEAGRQDIPLSRVIDMCAVVHVTIGDIVGGGESIRPVEQLAALHERETLLIQEVDRLRTRIVQQDERIDTLARAADQSALAARRAMDAVANAISNLTPATVER